MAIKAPIKRLTQVQYLTMYDFIRSLKMEELKDFQALQKLFETDPRFEKMEVTEYHIRAALKTLGIQAPKKTMIRMGRVIVPRSGDKDRVRVIARNLIGLMRELGKEPDADLLSIIGITPPAPDDRTQPLPLQH